MRWWVSWHTSHFGAKSSRDRKPKWLSGLGCANANGPLRFCHIDTKRSVLWPSKYWYTKIRFQPGFAPDPGGGAHEVLPDPLVNCRGDTSHTTPHSALTHLQCLPCVPSEFQPDLCLWWNGNRTPISNMPNLRRSVYDVGVTATWHQNFQYYASSIYVVRRQYFV